jgi:hypothetical protein
VKGNDMADSDPVQLGRIFINYRRADTDWQASWLYQHVGGRFGRDQVFKDVDNIRPGDDFVEVLSEAVGMCDVLLALIGPNWLSASHGGGRRLDDPDDYVRIEIEAALDRNVRVIPLLIGDVEMPASAELPASLAPLTRRHAIQLSAHRFQDDSEPVLAQIESTLAEQAARRTNMRSEQERTEAEERARREADLREEQRQQQRKTELATAERVEQERLRAERAKEYVQKPEPQSPARREVVEPDRMHPEAEHIDLQRVRAGRPEQFPTAGDRPQEKGLESSEPSGEGQVAAGAETQRLVGLNHSDRILSQQPRSWKVVNSLWIAAVVLGLGFLSILGWVWGAAVARTRWMWMLVAGYGLLTVLAWTLLALSPVDADGNITGPVSDAFAVVVVVVWLGGSIHAALTGKSVLRLAAARRAHSNSAVGSIE